jgi:phenylalanyl-tRNA synthetase beta chain
MQMLISYNWLQKYFKEQLPEPEALFDMITMKFLEGESFEQVGTGSGYKDTIFDIKVLPDRAGYCLSHRYMAQEISAVLGSQYILPHIEEFDTVTDSELSRNIKINFTKDVVDKKSCKRYIARYIEGVKVSESPSWLKDQLEVLGQRSINNIVDLSNYIMLESGQPLHAFDADLVVGDIEVRFAREGESIVILDGNEISLHPSVLVIADEQGPLAIAGVKGGKRAEVSISTKSLILESACFDGPLIRRTSQMIGIKNDSSKRFENAVTSERAGLGMALLTAEIIKMHKDSEDLKVSEALDIHPHPDQSQTLMTNVSKINERIGIDIPTDKVVEILTSCGLTVSISDEANSDQLTVSVPVYRSDIKIAEDLVDEVGRLYGYENLNTSDSSLFENIKNIKNQSSDNKNFYYHNQIRQILKNKGFSEIKTHTLVDKSITSLQNPLTVERAYLRDNLSMNLSKKILPNMRNIDLLGKKSLKMFEIGKVFGPHLGLQSSQVYTTGSQGDDSDNSQTIKETVIERERYTLALAMAFPKKPKGLDIKSHIQDTLFEVFESLGKEGEGVKEIDIDKDNDLLFTEVLGDAQTTCSGMVIEVDLDKVIQAQDIPEAQTDTGTGSSAISTLVSTESFTGKVFTPISNYPFSARDIAVFVPGENPPEDSDKTASKVSGVIISSLSDEQKKLLVRCDLFDVFTKSVEGQPVKTSYGYRLVFQSLDRTLTEDEVISMMQDISDGLSQIGGWEVR